MNSDRHVAVGKSHVGVVPVWSGLGLARGSGPRRPEIGGRVATGQSKRGSEGVGGGCIDDAEFRSRYVQILKSGGS